MAFSSPDPTPSHFPTWGLHCLLCLVSLRTAFSPFLHYHPTSAQFDPVHNFWYLLCPFNSPFLPNTTFIKFHTSYFPPPPPSIPPSARKPVQTAHSLLLPASMFPVLGWPRVLRLDTPPHTHHLPQSESPVRTSDSSQGLLSSDAAVAAAV